MIKHSEFMKMVRAKGQEMFRPMVWREDTRAYYVLVSEVMLQQTQAARVQVKFAEFIAKFPDIETLAKTSLGDVLSAWSGLGYNRRAKYLWQAAQMVVSEFDGVIPSSQQDLVKLPGVGVNTAGAVLAYSFNQPVVFVETNIRTVYLHHFFAGRDDVTDSEIRDKVAKTLDTKHPREWYWALMDYGIWLKSQGLGHISASKHYTKQSKLVGSVREVRGQILRELKTKSMTEKQLRALVSADERFDKAFVGLTLDGLIEKSSQTWRLPA